MKIYIYLATLFPLILLLSRRMFRKTWEWSIRQSFCLLWSVKMICSLHSNWEHLLFLVFNFQMDKIRARKLLVIIEMVLFIDWYHLYYSRYHPSIIVIPPNEIEINPYSTDILYYTAGFILQRLFVAKTEKWSFRYWLTTFTESSTMLLDDEIDEGLPTSIIEHYQLNNLFCPNQRFFSFIQNYWSKLYFKFHVGNDDCIWWRISHWWDQQCIERR